MVINTRKDIFGDLYTDIVTKEIYPTSRLVASITGIEPQPNKAIVGKNAFAHESGIPQDGMLKCAQTYDITRAESIGAAKTKLVLGKHSGRQAFKDSLKELGFELKNDELDKAFADFKALCDMKKEIFDEDLRALVNSEIAKVEQIYSIEKLSVQASKDGHTSAAITILHENELKEEASLGNGSADAIFKVIDRISGHEVS